MSVKAVYVQVLEEQTCPCAKRKLEEELEATKATFSGKEQELEMLKDDIERKKQEIETLKAEKEAELQAKTQELEQARQEIATKDERIAELERNQANSGNQPTDPVTPPDSSTDQPTNTDQPTAPVTPPLSYELTYRSGVPEGPLHVGQPYTLYYDLAITGGDPNKQYDINAEQQADNSWLRASLNATESTGITPLNVYGIGPNEFVFSVNGGDQHLTLAVNLTPLQKTGESEETTNGVHLFIDALSLMGPEQQGANSHQESKLYEIID